MSTVTLQGIEYEITGSMNSSTEESIRRVRKELEALKKVMDSFKNSKFNFSFNANGTGGTSGRRSKSSGGSSQSADNPFMAPAVQGATGMEAYRYSIQEAQQAIGSFGPMVERSANALTVFNGIAHETGVETSNIVDADYEFKNAADRVSESMSEASSEASRFRSFLDKLNQSLSESGTVAKGASAKFMEFFNSIKRIAMYRLIRTALKEIAQGITEGTQNLYQWSQAGGDLGVFAATMDSLATATLYLKNSIGAVAGQIISILAPAIEWLIDKFVGLLNIINQVIATMTGASTWNKAIKYPITYGDAAGLANKKAKELRNTILGFDEINRLDDPNKGSSATGKKAWDFSSMFEQVPLTGTFAKIKDVIQAHLKEIEALLYMFEFAIGLILFFTGHPILGVALMAHAAYKLITLNSTIDWNSIKDEIRQNLALIEGMVGGFALAIGVLLLMGGNIPLGLACIAVGAAMIYQSLSINWRGTEEHVTTIMDSITGIALGALMGMGLLLVLTGANVPLGLGMIVAGLTIGVTAIASRWEEIPENVRQTLASITAIAAVASIAVGMLLALTGVSVVGGLLLVAAGMTAAYKTVNWDMVPTEVRRDLTTITTVAGISLLAIGLMLVLTGAAAPLGFGMMVAGGASLATALVLNWDWLPDKIGEMLGNISGGVSRWWTNFKDGIVGAWNKLKEWWNNLSLPSIKMPTINLPRFNGIGGYAEGGFPDKGELFIARESGPEMVGSINGRAAVANNDMIIAGIEQGVYNAVVEGLGSFQGDSGDTVIMIDSEEIARANIRGTRKLDRRYNPTVKFTG